MLQLVKGQHTQLQPDGRMVNLALSYRHNAPLVADAVARVEQELVDELHLAVQRSPAKSDAQGSTSNATAMHTCTSIDAEAYMEGLLLRAIARATACLVELSNKLSAAHVMHS